MKTIALIPARAGSKRIPNKNVIELNGKPLIQWSIDALKKVQEIDEIWVSTNCERVAEVAFKNGINIFPRSEYTAHDQSSSEEALLEFAHKKQFDILVFVQATSPILLPENIAHGIQKVASGNCDSVLAVCEDKRFYWNKNKTPINYDPTKRPRTQNKEPWYKETGAFYITNRESLLESKCRISGKIGFAITPEISSFEIDTYEDLAILSVLLHQL